jgi:hypothetical protein
MEQLCIYETDFLKIFLVGILLKYVDQSKFCYKSKESTYLH